MTRVKEYHHNKYPAKYRSPRINFFSESLLKINYNCHYCFQTFPEHKKGVDVVWNLIVFSQPGDILTWKCISF